MCITVHLTYVYYLLDIDSCLTWYVTVHFTAVFLLQHDDKLSPSERTTRRAPPLVSSTPKFSHSENCCFSENRMSTKFFWI